MPLTPTVDPRGQRFIAAITSVVLAVVLLVPSPAREIVLAFQVAVFATGAFGALSASPYAQLFARLVRPRIGPPAEREDARPPRFAQVVGFTFAAIALLGFVSGLTTLGLVATGFALAAALLNATTGFCLGCELYLLIQRLTHRDAVPQKGSTP